MWPGREHLNVMSEPSDLMNTTTNISGQEQINLAIWGDFEDLNDPPCSGLG